MMKEITVGVLTISDRCTNKEVTDESGPLLVKMIQEGIINKGVVVKTEMVPDVKENIQEVLLEWCDKDNINVILTTGGTGISSRDLTPEATTPLLDKVIPGITQLILQKSLTITPLAALSRAVAGVRKKSLILNFPGSKKACKECLEVVSNLIPHAVALILEIQKDVEKVHSNLNKKKLNISINSSYQLRKSVYDAVTVDIAQKCIFDRINLLTRTESIDLENALNHVLVEDAIANDFLPQIDVSICDGYAIPYTENGNFNRLPPNLKVLSTFSPGKSFDPNLKLVQGVCIKVSTGGPIPLETYAVVRVENTKVVKTNEGSETISFTSVPPKGADIRKKGCEYKKGEILLNANTKLDAAALGLLASAGITHSIRVYKKPIVAIISTGDEIVEPHVKPSLWNVRDSNRTFLINLLKEEGYTGIDLGLVGDDPDDLYEILVKGFRVSDIVVTTGSMSMGEKDILKDILETEFQAEICFGRVWMKPGLPTAFALVDFEGKSKAWFGFPGNPASAAVASYLFLLPALKKIQKLNDYLPKEATAYIAHSYESESNRPHYMRGVLSLNEENKFVVSSTGQQMSSRIASCVNSNCLILIQGTTGKLFVEAGTCVTVYITGKIN